MATQKTITVSKRDGPSVEVTFQAPDNLQDPRWKELVTSDDDISTLAAQALIVKIQSGARGELDKGEAAVQAYVNSYKYKAGGGTRTVKVAPKPVDKALQKKAKFSADQLAALKAAGFEIEE